MNELNFDNSKSDERLDKLLLTAINNIKQIKSILGKSEVEKLLDDAELACIQAKEINSLTMNDFLDNNEDDGSRFLKTAERRKFMKSINGKKILILEDEKAVIRMITSLLEKNGCVVTGVETVEEAVEEYRHSIEEKKKFDIVILDMIIHGRMGGIDCLNQLLQLDPELNAIMSSGYYESIAVDVRKKFKAILQKPYTYGDLISTLAKCCGN